MTKLPKELTPELLSLVYPDYNNRLCEWMEIEDNEINTYYDCGHYDSKGRPTGLGMTISIDTLTRLILEAIEAKGYIYNLFNSTSVQGYVMIIDDRKYIAKTIFEVALKHLVQIAKEKGLLNGR